MKTIAGAPQFEADDYQGIDGQGQNRRLRKWAEDRRCINCIHLGRAIKVVPVCNYLAINLKARPLTSPEFFSCLAFEEKP